MIEDRLAHLEGRLGPLLDERVALSSRVAGLERELGEARAELRERVHELDLRLAATTDVRSDLVELRGHLDALATEQLARSLELGKLDDRVVRMEMRFGDLLKEHGTHLADHEDVKKGLAALAAERARERTDLEQLGERGLEIERIIRQVELRLGDLAERHTGAREDLAGLAARTAQLELTTAPPPAPSTAIDRSEGH
ncbi:MAG: hypothetical protein HY271_05780 [Deltaproteobacteria bacterium]|nr:hypothetical protein [Deltaproteobacteria bacterium]